MNPEKDKVLTVLFIMTFAAAIVVWMFNYSWYQDFFWGNVAIPPKDLEDPVYSMIGNGISFFALPFLAAILIGSGTYWLGQKFYNPQKVTP